MKRLALLLLLFPTVLPAQTRDVSRYERVLLPLLPVTTNGAFGSQWQTQLWMRNDSDQPNDAFPLSRDCISSFACFASMRDAPAFEPHMIGYHTLAAIPFFLGLNPGPTPGAFLYVERAKDLSFQLTVRDLSRGTQSFGTRIPVVPESDFFTGTRSIIGVPISSGGRTSLRVYSAQPGTVELRIEGLTEYYSVGPPILQPPTRFVDAQLDLVHDAASDRCTFFISGCPDAQYKPSVLEITDLLQRFPELQGAVDLRNGVRIEIQPLTPGLTYWPMVTTTSNTTNEVTVYLVR